MADVPIVPDVAFAKDITLVDIVVPAPKSVITIVADAVLTLSIELSSTVICPLPLIFTSLVAEKPVTAGTLSPKVFSAVPLLAKV